MTYDEYTVKVRARMKKLVSAENFIKKYRFLIIAVADILFIAFIFTMYFAGSYIKDLTVRNVVYGEEGISRAAAFLSGIKYSYTENGEEKTGLPYGAGIYDITAETNNPFGVVRRQTASLMIYKKSAFISLSDFSVEYGEEPEIKGIVASSDLAAGDVITDAEISYDKFAKTSDAAVVSITIVNKYGLDVTSSYDLRFGSAKATVTPRKITVDTGSAEKKYDMEELTCKEFEITQGSLAYDDVISADFPSSIKLPGTESNKADIKIYTKDGGDVSDKYTVTERIGSLTVYPLEIRIKTGSSEKEYDKEPLECKEYEIISSELPHGYECEVSNFPKITEPGSIYNNVKVRVKDENKVYIDDSIFDAKIDRGILTVTGRKITLRSPSSSYIYNGQSHNAKNSVKLASGQLFENDFFSTYNHPTEAMAGEYQNTFSVRFSGIVPKNAYDITYEYGTLEIKKKQTVLSVTVHGDASRHTNNFTADISGEVVKNDSIITPMYIPLDISYDAFESYIKRNLVIVHGSNRSNASDSYDVTYIIEFDENELDDFRAAAGVSENESGQGVGTAHGDGTSGDGTLPDIDTPDETGPVISAEEKYGGSGIGSNGVGGGIDNSPSPYAVLPDNAPDAEKTAVGTVSSFREGAVYLRLRSFGNYTGTGWSEPALYESKTAVHPLNMTYTSLIVNNYTELNEIEVNYSAKDGLVPVPYYTFSQKYGASLTMTDVAVPRENDVDTFYFNQIPIVGVSTLLSLEDDGTVSEDYKDFVYKNYLSLPEKTETEIKKIIEKAGLDSSSPTIIQDVADFLKNAYSYNGSFEKIPDGEDRVVYFLTNSREGICGHFASAATVIYRALGIPARYTVGYYVLTGGRYEITEFYGKDAHAWAEVFADGIGWIPVEVTSTSVASAGEEADLQPPKTGSEVFYNKLYYQMISKSKIYDGETLYSDEVELAPGSNLRDGDRIEAKTRSIRFAGTLTAGSSEFAVYDEKENDVTLLYEVREVGYAALTVQPRVIDLPEISLYIGQTVSLPSYENAADEETGILMRGHRIAFDLSDNNCVVINENGTVTGVCAENGYVAEDSIDLDADTDPDGISQGAEIVFCQSMTVLPFENIRIKDGEMPEKQASPEVVRMTGENGKIYNYIVIRSDNAEKSFDGEYLRSSGYEILYGAPEKDHSIQFESGAYQLYVGKNENVFSRLRITDEHGFDVTGEYIIDFYPGTLTVTAGEYAVTDTEIDAEVDKKIILDSVNRTEGVSNVRISYEKTGDKPIIRVEDGVLIGIEPGVTHIKAVFHGEDLNGDGVNEYISSAHTLTVNVNPKKQDENAWLYTVLALAIAAAGSSVIFVSLKAARIKKEEATEK